MKSNILKISMLSFLMIFASCDIKKMDDFLENPNEVNVSQLDKDLLMNKIQLEFGDFIARANDPTTELVRMRAMTGGDTYDTAYQPQTFDLMWETAYQRLLVQVETLLTSLNGTQFTAHTGAAKIIKAYTYLTLVDLYGDVPFSEASKGLEGNFNPKADGGAAIYTACIKLLDEAIVDLAKTPIAGMSRDVFYASNRTRWTAAANTFKLKAYMNLRLSNSATAKAEIEKLLAADLIDTDAEEFTYKYGTSDVPQRSRNPRYRDMYQPNAGLANGYLGNYFMINAYKGKGVEDPRWRYYFYRQVGSLAKAVQDEPETVTCRFQPRPEFISASQGWCAFDPGFFGRDHGNGDGAPPDTRAVTTFGVYPYGGRVDTNVDNKAYANVTQQGQGANGAGIEPIWMAFFTDFVKAEAAQTLGTAGSAEALMVSGITKSIARVKAFGAAKGQVVPEAIVAPDSSYIKEVKARFTKATDKIEVIGKEYYLSLWGNGIEAYNLLRRTGAPRDIQPARAINPGKFYRSLKYPANYANLNANATQKTANDVKVFWDTNPVDFVK